MHLVQEEEEEPSAADRSKKKRNLFIDDIADVDDDDDDEEHEVGLVAIGRAAPGADDQSITAEERKEDAISTYREREDKHAFDRMSIGPCANTLWHLAADSQTMTVQLLAQPAHANQMRASVKQHSSSAKSVHEG